jgi:putative FmdB family regulatory protein
MPIYEYQCHACSGRFQKLVQGFSDPPGLACPRCGNNQVRRAVSRFATLKSEEARVEAMADPMNFAGLDENDPRSIARWAKRMGKELGEDAGEDWDELVDQMLDEEMSEEAGDEPTDDDTPPRPAKKADDLGWA